jgi:polysaccharide deacetylase 2 family uncharacterized protein YibQ
MEKNRSIIVALTILILIIAVAFTACGKKNGKDKVSGFDNATGEYMYDEQGQASDPENASDPNSGDSLLQAKTTDNKAVAAAKDSTSLKSLKYTWTDSKDIPPVIIVVDDFGMADGSLLQGFAELPSEVVFAVLPDLPKTQKSAQIASQYGHEVLIHVPMEAKAAKTKPGTRYIKSGQDDETVTTMLDSFYSQIPNAIGANNHMGSTATADRDLMTVVLKHLNGKGLFFMDSMTTGSSVAHKLANTLGYRSIRRDIFLDVPDVTDATIASKISDLGKYKGRKQPIVIISHCHNQAKLEALRSFITQIRSMGVNLTTFTNSYAAGQIPVFSMYLD